MEFLLPKVLAPVLAGFQACRIASGDCPLNRLAAVERDLSVP